MSLRRHCLQFRTAVKHPATLRDIPSRRYLTAMIRGLPLRPEPHLLRPIQLLLLLVAFTGALGRDRLSGAGALCAQHMDTAPSVATQAEGAGAPASEGRDHDASSLTESGHQCTHCPPSECATMVPCGSGGPSTQSVRAAVPTLVNLPVHAASETIPAQHAASVSPQPPTPPPQVAS